MEQAPIPNNVKRIIAISYILIIISTFIVVFIGTSLTNVHNDIKRLNMFLAATENIKPNFEKSLQAYTENTQNTIAFLLSLRPATEENYIKFISTVEDLSQKLSLNLELQSVNIQPKKTKKNGNGKNKFNSLYYDISFFGRLSDLQKFLKELEGLDYYIGIEELNYRNPEYIMEKAKDQEENIKLRIKLFIK